MVNNLWKAGEQIKAKSGFTPLVIAKGGSGENIAAFLHVVVGKAAMSGANTVREPRRRKM